MVFICSPFPFLQLCHFYIIEGIFINSVTLNCFIFFFYHATIEGCSHEHFWNVKIKFFDCATMFYWCQCKNVSNVVFVCSCRNVSDQIRTMIDTFKSYPVSLCFHLSAYIINNVKFPLWVTFTTKLSRSFCFRVWTFRRTGRWWQCWSAWTTSVITVKTK